MQFAGPAVIRKVRGDEGLRLRDVRLRALRDAPAALGDYLAEELAFPADYWQSIAEDTQTGGPRVSLVAEAEGRLVGMVGGHFRRENDAVHLVALWVDPASRHRGVGRGLVEAVVSWALECGAERVELWVVDDHPAATALYEATGFVSTGIRQPVPHSAEAMETLFVRLLSRR